MYKLDYQNQTIEAISTDLSCSPFIDLYPMGDVLLAFKQSVDGSQAYYFESINPDNGATSIILREKNHENFRAASVQGNSLFLYLSEITEENGYRLIIREYTLPDLVIQRVIDLENINNYLTETDIQSMAVFGNYLYFENLSNDSVLCRIDTEGVAQFERMRHLVLVNGSADASISERIFYVRRTSEYYIFAPSVGELVPYVMELDDGYVIRSMFSDGNSIIVKTCQSTDSKLYENNSEVIYHYSYADFIEIHSND